MSLLNSIRDKVADITGLKVIRANGRTDKRNQILSGNRSSGNKLGQLLAGRKQKTSLKGLQDAAAGLAEDAARIKQQKKGKLTARERIDLLLDEGTFLEVGRFVGADLADENYQGAAVVTGFGFVGEQRVAVYSQDFTIHGGSLGEVEGQKICDLIDRALDERIPVVAILDSGGARIQQGVAALGYYGKIFRKTVEASGVIPQISLILGPCAGGAVYCPALTDFIVMTQENSHMFVTGPDVVKAVTGEEVTADDLGGGMMHSSISGVCNHLAENEESALEWTRVLLSFLPQNFETPTISYPYQDNADDQNAQNSLTEIVPEDPKQSYNMLDVVYALVDYGEFLEVSQLFAPNIIVGLGRFNGQTCGIVANQPEFNAGTLDIDASEKLARFVRFCDAFSIPVVTLVDVPGYRPGTNQEHAGIIRRGAKVITAYAEATVPLVTVILRKAYGGAYIVMGSKEIGADFNFAWPTAQIAVLGAEGAVEIVHRRDLRNAREAGQDVDQLKQHLIDEYNKKTINANLSQEKGAIDALIEPETTRENIIRSLAVLRDKKPNRVHKKHDNQPL
ncbi:MAG: acyl-CoA carboxylase subunit beta [Candidatus Ancillula sp.]|jgi:acetyl-CoA carboxylase carboxyltransferase component|nr:acyl-CoA carboxylase subunit beta [Candidatus Ancillula sp.]